MNVSRKRGFYYHADANALGGQLEQPFARSVSTSSSVSLAAAGGSSSSRVERFDLEGLISFESARVSVTGVASKEDAGWRSVATASVEKLNILQVLTADRLVAQLSVTHFEDENRPAEISFNGAQFVNLRLNGELLKLEWDPELMNHQPEDQCASPQPQASDVKGQKGSANLQFYSLPHFADLLRAAERQYRDDAIDRDCFVKTLGSRFALNDPRADLEKKGCTLCSLVKDVDVPTPGTSFGHVVHLPDFGNIFLGELRVTPFSAQLTMLRAEMGCIAEGNLTVASAYSNGSTMP
jgi:hypothetical protein